MYSLPRRIVRPAVLYCILAPLLSATSPELVHAQERQTLTFQDLMKVRQIQSPSISADGRWVALAAVPDRGDGESLVYSADGGIRRAIPRGSNPVISADGLWVAARLEPSFEDRETAARGETPRPGLTLLHTGSGEAREWEEIQRFGFSSDGNWLARLGYPVTVFEAEAKTIADVAFLAQGTLYPDIIESQSAFRGPTSVIKSHHNVGGLPKNMKLKLVEPLKYLFKDEVRLLGKALSLDEDLIWRQPFPGPGLAIRIIGEINNKRLMILRNVDDILLDEIKNSGYYRKLWQSFAVLLPIKSVGVMGDKRTYENIIAIRAVTSKDAMTADWARLPHKLLGKISNRIINEVSGVNRVVYDISSKPPSTIEWE